MPRPDLEALGVNYRRIPVVAIGRDIYCDTLLILQKLEKLYPAGGNIKQSLAGTTPEHKGLELLLEKWTDVVVFPRAAADAIPLDHPLVVDPKFIKDRSELWGDSWAPDARAKKRPAALVNMRECFDLLENTIFSDGRKWVGGARGPTLADIHGVWIFDWMIQIPGAWPSELISGKIYPNTYAWADRYHKAVEAASGKNEVIEGPEALKRVHAGSALKTTGVDAHDPLGFKEGDKVKVGPTDTGFNSLETGTLEALNAHEIVVKTSTKPAGGSKGEDVFLHVPRWNYQVQAA